MRPSLENTNTEQRIIKLIKQFKKEHEEIFDDVTGDTDCVLVSRRICRVAPKQRWLGTDESYKQAIREQKEMDKVLKCYVCEFIKQLKEVL